MKHIEPSSLKGVYRLFKPEGQSSPILFDSPHSGTHKPDDFGFSCPEKALDSLSDLYVDELFSDSPLYGATFLHAETSRAYIDFNRPLDDIDLTLLSDVWGYPISSKGRSKHGVGLTFSKGKDGVSIYNRKLSSKEITQRIEHYYTPYHTVLKQELARLRTEHGDVIHINCHSFPSKQGIRQLPDFVLGDRHGTTCSPHILHKLKQVIETYGYSVTLNYPYQGQEIVKSTGQPTRGQHAIQIEINRALYMDEEKQIKNIKFNKLKDKINLIIKDLNSLFFSPALAAD
jgi:N-formylglutamate amidohydrolase